MVYDTFLNPNHSVVYDVAPPNINGCVMAHFALGMSLGLKALRRRDLSAAWIYTCVLGP